MKRKTLRERALMYGQDSSLQKTHDTKGPWWAGYRSGNYDGWLAGYRAAQLDRRKK